MRRGADGAGRMMTVVSHFWSSVMMPGGNCAVTSCLEHNYKDKIHEIHLKIE
jgi:hypothetical protein